MKPSYRLLSEILLIVLCSCGSTKHAKQEQSTTIEFTATPAEDWNQLFRRNQGWFGGDGLFSVAFNGLEKKTGNPEDSVLIWFSDTMIGNIVDSVLYGDTMINNSFAVMQNREPGNNGLRFYWKADANGRPTTIFEPNTGNTVPGEYYWLGDGFVNEAKNNDLYIFGYRIMNIPGKAAFGFRQTGNTLIRIPCGDRPPFSRSSQIDLPLINGLEPDSSGSFGSALLINTRKSGAARPDGFVYIYGVRGELKEVIVARVRPGQIEEPDKWTYWNGRGWTATTSELQPIADRASNEMSVTALEDGRYIMIFQKDAIGTKIGMRIGTSPAGPFGPIIDVYDVKEDLKDSPNLIPYNAKAHPVLSNPGELLISYHINSFNFTEDIRKFPHLYSPRFIRVMYK